MIMGTMTVEHIHERAGKHQQIRKRPEQVRTVLSQEEEERNRNKAGQNPSGPAGHAGRRIVMLSLIHGISP